MAEMYGFLDSESKFALVLPGLRQISKSYCCSGNDHLARRPVGSLMLINQRSARWSVYII